MVQLPLFSHAPIDIHSHFNHGSPYDDRGTPEETHNRNLSFVKAGYDHIGVCAAGMSTFASVLTHPECVVEENRYLNDLVNRTDWMYQWVVIDPRQPETYRQAEEMLPERKTLGIKIHPTYQDYDIRDHGDALFSFAARYKATVLMHPQYIEDMAAFADRYPDMNLIIAHLGSIEHVDAVAAAQYGNIYVDTSGGASSLNNILEYAAGRIGADKILFGTDTYSCAFQFGRIALSVLPQEEKEKILFGNAMRLFPRAFRESL
ncbi:MAG: amidohydrolase [Ruminococcaceae bacterium]|nr:amidohydrolase [Oscillospiraceae bacterium]